MKTALIIDGNYLLHKDVFILFGMRSLHQDLQTLLRKEIEKLIRMYPFDDIYFVSDSRKGYWRKLEYPAYKSDREHDDKIDWDWVYKEYETFKSYLKEHQRVKQLQFDLAEGDDIIAYIVNRNNELGYSNVILAADSDLHQLVRFDLSKEYINVAYNYKFSDERVHVPENYNVYFHEMKKSASTTLFDMTDDDEYLAFLEELLNRTKVVEVSYEQLLFTKLISGDKKDTITSVFQKETKTGRMMGIGKDGAKNIYNLYKETFDEPINFDKNEFILKATEMVSFNKKVTDENIKDSIKDNIKRNRKLIKLTENYLPQNLLEVFDKKINIG
jgi:hypothetical protein